VTVETFNHHVQRKKDLLGIGDVLGVHPVDRVMMLVQATTAAHVPDRLKRCRARRELAIWLRAGGLFEVHGWRRGKDGRWQLRRVPVTLESLADAELGRAPRRQRSAQSEMF